MEKQIDTAKNGSGHRFVIQWHASGDWCATQLDGVQDNYCSIPALLHAPSRRALIADLRTHFSN